MANERALRVLTLLTSALATPLLIGCTVASLQGRRRHWYMHKRQVTAFCFGYIPLALTAGASLFSLIYHRRNGRLPNFKLKLVDLFAAIFYFAVLVPIWAKEIGELGAPGLGLLAGYATAPMIINLFTHIYFFLCNARFLWSWIFSQTEHECPNCRSKFTNSMQQVQETSKGGGRYSLLRGEDYLDEDAVAYTDARDSEERVGMQGDVEVEDKGKGNIKI